MSHSTKDLEKVRRVRNAIESLEGEPIIFFLKCLSEHDEIDSLIKREIQARNFFLLCNSSNARASRWVQSEITCVKSLEGKTIEEIDLESGWQAQLQKIRELLKQARIFLSYLPKDEKIVSPIRKALILNDLAVWDPAVCIRPGDNFASEIREAIEAAARFGYFIRFVSYDSINSPYMKMEYDEFKKYVSDTQIINVQLEKGQENASCTYQNSIDYSSRNLEALLDQLLALMGIRNTVKPDQTRED
jgi:hypothetical protein